MKQWIKHLGLRLAGPVDQFLYYFNFFGWKKLDQIAALNRQTQIELALQYREWLAAGRPPLRFDEVEFRAFSQHGEDGILHYLFSVLGTTNRRVVEVCAGDGVECNAANLIINHGWEGMLFDGDAAKLRFGRAYYRRNLNTLPHPPVLIQAWIEAETINSLFLAQGLSGPLDLFSLDMDGVDYWVWEALTCIQPRVIVLEYNAALGPERALTVPYRRDFRAQGRHWGASLPAFVKLGERKGYRLVGVEHSGVNAFFLRSDVGVEWLPTLTPAVCFAQCRAQVIYEQFHGQAMEYPWVEV